MGVMGGWVGFPLIYTYHLGKSTLYSMIFVYTFIQVQCLHYLCIIIDHVNFVMLSLVYKGLCEF